MKFLKTSLTLLVLSSILACSSNKNAADVKTAEKMKQEVMTPERMMEEGFKMGTIVASNEEGDCPYTIRVVEGEEDYLLDPINLDEGFMNDGEKIWFKFTGLRMQNRCMKANPVNLVAIEKREE